MTLHQAPAAPAAALCGYCEFRHVGPHVPLPAYCTAHGRALPCRSCSMFRAFIRPARSPK